MREPISGPTAWTAQSIAESTEWIYRFSAAEVAEIDAALRHARSRGCTMATLTREDFPLPTVGRACEAAQRQLEDGVGMQLFRGFPANDYGKDDLRLIYWGLGLYLGTAVSQSMNGDLLGDVRNQNVDMDGPQGRGYTTNRELGHHTDSCDVVALFVLRTAKSGGLSKLASSVSVHNEMLRLRPDLVETLYQPFYWSWQGQEPADSLPYYPQPVFTLHDGKFACRYVRTHIVSAQRYPEVPRLTQAQTEAMDLLRELAGSERFSFSMMFEPGDLQLLNNHVTLHSRTAFEDYDEPDRRRHLLRMWLSMPNSRDLSPALGNIYRDQRGGTVRGGFPSKTGKLIFETRLDQAMLD